MKKTSVAVVTGGHSYDVPKFHKLFNSLKDLNPVIQHMDDFASSPQEVRDAYDAVLFYIMLMEGPADDGMPWYAGKPKSALEHLGETAQGIVILHHAILAYPKWSVWSEIVGINDRGFGYYADQTLRLDAADAEHPITRGLSGWQMVDETYTMSDAGAGSRILLTVDHPKSMKSIAWTRQHKKSRVFCFESGHDNQTWRDGNFKEVLRRGILWAAGAI